MAELRPPENTTTRTQKTAASNNLTISRLFLNGGACPPFLRPEQRNFLHARPGTAGVRRVKLCAVRRSNHGAVRVDSPNGDETAGGSLVRGCARNCSCARP